MSSAEKIAAAETEVEMVSDMFNRLTESCQKKCIPNDYREGDLNKGESVCLDRCVSKFFEVNIKVSEKMQGEAAQKQGAPGFGM
ncbi:Tim10/DDP family zinc finger protein [Aspergillus novofumigatus IBT 16806]|nr:putative mitochondrial intermembrane space translocase subunit Tim10 [Aspergillus novofumigatus IBT 16806]PKX89513.1 putative mitochondrial intermembrane space translocase subunit Tim10 [Aspergillus novofumigatus IBT 16806]